MIPNIIVWNILVQYAYLGWVWNQREYQIFHNLCGSTLTLNFMRISITVIRWLHLMNWSRCSAISSFGSYARTTGKRFVIQFWVITLESTKLPFNCSGIHCLAAINIYRHKELTFGKQLEKSCRRLVKTLTFLFHVYAAALKKYSVLHLLGSNVFVCLCVTYMLQLNQILL